MTLYNNPRDGYSVCVEDNGRHVHTMLVREGCSETCAAELYVSKGTHYLDDIGLYNLHFSDRELGYLLDARPRCTGRACGVERNRNGLRNAGNARAGIRSIREYECGGQLMSQDEITSENDEVIFTDREVGDTAWAQIYVVGERRLLIRNKFGERWIDKEDVLDRGHWSVPLS